MYRISQEMDGANGRIFLLHVDGTEWCITVEYSRTFSEVSDKKKKGISNDDVKYSDQFTNLKQFLAGCKDNEEFCILHTGTPEVDEILWKFQKCRLTIRTS